MAARLNTEVRGMVASLPAPYSDLVNLAEQYSLPDYVKAADLDSTMLPPPDMPRSAFADPLQRRFPCHTKAATWVSAVTFLTKRAEHHPKTAAQIEQRLQRSIDFWGLAGDFQRVKQAHDNANAEATAVLPDDMYAYVFVDSVTGEKERSYRLANAVEVKVAADWLEEHRDAIPFEIRHIMA